MDGGGREDGFGNLHVDLQGSESPAVSATLFAIPMLQWHVHASADMPAHLPAPARESSLGPMKVQAGNVSPSLPVLRSQLPLASGTPAHF